MNRSTAIGIAVSIALGIAFAVFSGDWLVREWQANSAQFALWSGLLIALGFFLGIAFGGRKPKAGPAKDDGDVPVDEWGYPMPSVAESRKRLADMSDPAMAGALLKIFDAGSIDTYGGPEVSILRGLESLGLVESSGHADHTDWKLRENCRRAMDASTREKLGRLEEQLPE